jgi:glutathionylspermidine synthase
MSDDACEDEDTEERQRDEEQVEVLVVALAHTVPHPRAMVVKPLWNTTIINKAFRK